jgi:RNA polymerase sigma-B factor
MYRPNRRVVVDRESEIQSLIPSKVQGAEADREVTTAHYCGTRITGGSDDPRLVVRAYQRTRDHALRERLVELYLPLVRSIARRYAHCGERLEDLVQVGCIGLIEAIDRFDCERGEDLAAFAIPTIHGEIRNHLRDRSAPVRVPRRVTELALALRPSREHLSHRLQRSPTTSELADEAGVGEADVVEAARSESARAPASLSAAQADHRFLDLLRTRPADLELIDDRLLLAVALRTLAARERRILHLRFYEDLSQAEIGREVGLSQIQVSRLIRASLERMRGALAPSSERVADQGSRG